MGQSLDNVRQLTANRGLNNRLKAVKNPKSCIQLNRANFYDLIEIALRFMRIGSVPFQIHHNIDDGKRLL